MEKLVVVIKRLPRVPVKKISGYPFRCLLLTALTESIRTDSITLNKTNIPWNTVKCSIQ